MLHLLVGCGIRRVDRLGLLELRQRELQIALLEGFLALLDVELAGLEAQVHRPKLVFGVGGFGPEGALVVNQRGIVVLQGFGLATRTIVFISFGAAGYKNGGERQKRQIPCAAQPDPPQDFLDSLGV
ncbi:MAG: hypothetical protein LAO24_25155 [Acidobacteriia bacterium]|nr:hypothetical protein [Terriglobia bacterium]